jgi:hypothetical protein
MYLPCSDRCTGPVPQPDPAARSAIPRNITLVRRLPGFSTAAAHQAAIQRQARQDDSQSVVDDHTASAVSTYNKLLNGLRLDNRRPSLLIGEASEARIHRKRFLGRSGLSSASAP